MSPMQQQRWKRTVHTLGRIEHPAGWLILAAGVGLLLAAALLARLQTLQPSLSGAPAIVDTVWQAWRKGAGAATQMAVMAALLVFFVYCVRRYRQAELVRKPGPIEVPTLENATGDPEVNVDELSAAFRVALDQIDLRHPAPIPGSGSSTDFLELVKSTEGLASPVKSIAALLGLTRVTHAIQVVATLRKRQGNAPFGITISVVTLPRGDTHSSTVWADSWVQTIHVAASAVGASVLPLTRLCRQPPWSAWPGRVLPPELFRDFVDAQSLASQHRYDEALGKYYSALRRDPMNLYIRLEIGALQEQLHLFLDALETYDDLIALGSRQDERRFQVLTEVGEVVINRVKRATVPSEPRRPIGSGWVGSRGQRGIRPSPWFHHRSALLDALLIARYRYSMVLGFSEVFLAQWMRDTDAHNVSRRDLERRRLRSRLRARLARYPYDTARTGDSASPSRSILAAVTPESDDSPEGPQLDRIAADLKRVIGSAKRKAKDPRHDVAGEHAQFEVRFARARHWSEDRSPSTARSLNVAAKSLLAAISVCPHVDWSAERAVAHELLPRVRRARPLHPTTTEVLRAQLVLQQAALAELRQLAKDYRWTRLRRRRSAVVSTRTLRVSVVWARLRLRRVESLMLASLDGAGATRGTNSTATDTSAVPPVSPETLPDTDHVRQRIDRALRGVAGRISWQDHYVAACTYAIALLPGNSWAGGVVGRTLNPRVTSLLESHDSSRFAEAAVRALERSMDSMGSTFAPERRDWVLSEDPDLVGFRGSEAYARFRRRNFPGVERPVPLPKNVHVLQLSAYVTLLLRDLAQASARRWAARTTPTPDAEVRTVTEWLDQDEDTWRTLERTCREHRDWRVRLEAIEHLRLLDSVDVTTPVLHYPRYPDRRIGDLANLSDPEDERCANTAGAFARQERVAQLERLADMVAARRETATHAEAQAAAHSLASLAAERRERWTLVDALLSINFFTDDDGRLASLKLESSRLEESLHQLLSCTDGPKGR